jgi:hypothetical protein
VAREVILSLRSNRSTDSVAKIILAAHGQKAWANAQLLPRNLCSEPEGTMLEVVVNEAGEVAMLTVLRGDALFDEAALEEISCGDRAGKVFLDHPIAV